MSVFKNIRIRLFSDKALIVQILIKARREFICYTTNLSGSETAYSFLSEVYFHHCHTTGVSFLLSSTVRQRLRKEV